MTHGGKRSDYGVLRVHPKLKTKATTFRLKEWIREELKAHKGSQAELIEQSLIKSQGWVAPVIAGVVAEKTNGELK